MVRTRRCPPAPLHAPPRVHPALCVRASDVVMKYKLKKVVEDWHSQPGDGFLYYMFRPPWVRSRATDTFFTLHPEERNYSTSLAATLKSEQTVLKEQAALKETRRRQKEAE